MFPVHPVIEVASVAHAEEIGALWRQARVEGGGFRDSAVRPFHTERVRAALERPGVRIFSARLGRELVGFAVVSQSALSGLAETSGMWVDMLYVAPEARRRGVARLLLGAVERHAHAEGADQLVVLAPAQARETNRFLARLGFGSRLSMRVTSPEALRLRLAPEDEVARERILQQRRSLLRARKRRVLSGEGA